MMRQFLASCKCLFSLLVPSASNFLLCQLKNLPSIFYKSLISMTLQSALYINVGYGLFFSLVYQGRQTGGKIGDRVYRAHKDTRKNSRGFGRDP